MKILEVRLRRTTLKMVLGYIQNGRQEDAIRQRSIIMNYALANNYVVSEIFTDNDFSSLQDKQLQHGDILVVCDMAYLGRTLQQIRNQLHNFMVKGVSVVSAADALKISPDENAISVLQGLDLALGIRNRLLSRTTSKALAERKAAGATLGRRKNANIKKRLDGREAEIKQFLAKGISKSEIARRLNVSRVTLYKFMENNKLKGEK